MHSHHHAESVLLFPALRRTNPALNPVVDKLEADHASVSDLLGEVETAARELSGTEDPAARTRLIEALHKLSADLLAHLQYEEDHMWDTLLNLVGLAIPMTGAQVAAGPEQATATAGEYACARAWAALTAAHARIAGKPSTALARACDLSINDFEILLRLDHAPAQGCA